MMIIFNLTLCLLFPNQFFFLFLNELILFIYLFNMKVETIIIVNLLHLLAKMFQQI